MADPSIANQLFAILTPNSKAALAAAPSLDTDLKSSNIAQNLEIWSDDLENQLLMGVVPHSSTANCATTKILKEAADKLHASILVGVDPSFVNSNFDGDAEADKATWAVVNSLSDGNLSNDDAESVTLDLGLLASLLRAAGLFLRWQSQIFQSSPLTSPMGSHCLTRLKSESMILLYAALLDMELIAPAPDVPRFASICLFRATYGNDESTTTARRQFVNSQYGISYLMKALLRGEQPVSRLISTIRNVHHLIASCPESIPKMENKLESLAATADEDKSNGRTYGLVDVLIATLSWTYRSQPPFPGGASDRRSDLVLEIVRALYALDPSNPSKSSQPTNDSMMRVGVILCELLQFPNSDERVYQIKLAAVALLLASPKECCDYLVNNDCVKRLVEILAYQASVVVIERTNSLADDATAVVPILLALLRLVQSNETALKVTKEAVFPLDDEGEFKQKAAEEVAKGNTDGKVIAKNMAPLNAPRGTLRWKLIQLMTWAETTVKRSACELLWALCDGDSTQFVLRTGFGNAIHFLGIKGCVSLPANV